MSGESPEPTVVHLPFMVVRILHKIPTIQYEKAAYVTEPPMIISQIEEPVYGEPALIPANESLFVPWNRSEFNIVTESALNLQMESSSQPYYRDFLPEFPNTSNQSQLFTLPDLMHFNQSTTNDDFEAAKPSALIVSQLCGFPMFCSSNALFDCANIALKECQQCNMAGASIFMVLIFLLGLLVLLGNGFVIWCNVAKKSGFSGTYSKIKASLALADMLTGFQIFGISIYNFSWTLNSTANELDQHELELEGSPQSIAGGIFYFLGFTASLYHLIFLGQQRFFAIRWPMRYRSQLNSYVYVGLVAVWGIAVFTSVIPTFFPSVYTFTYSHTTFLYNLTLKELTLNPDLLPLALLFTFQFIVPYLIMTVLTVASGVILRSYKKRSRDISQRREAHKVDKREKSVYKMLAIMQIGFTITLVPLLFVVILSYTDATTCETISAPLTVCIHLSMSNSLVNVIVYGFMDKNFRSALREDVLSCFRRKPRVSRSSTEGNQQTSKCSTSATKLQGSVATHSV